MGKGVNPIYTTVTRVNIPNSEDYGTGFFYNHNDKPYLVTNLHVLAKDGVIKDKDEADIEYLDEIRFFIRNHHDISQTSWIDVSLDQGIGEDTYIHPFNEAFDYNIDVAVIPLNQKLSNFAEYINNPDPDVSTGSTAFTPDLIMSGEDLLSGGDMAMIIGYPAEFVDTNNYFPILRNGRISSPLGLDFQGKPIFITDALMYEGTSGSPIVAGPETLKNPATGGLRTSSQGFGLLGIHSETYKRPSEVGPERLNLNAGWYANLINEIIESKLIEDKSRELAKSELNDEEAAYEVLEFSDSFNTGTHLFDRF